MDFKFSRTFAVLSVATIAGFSAMAADVVPSEIVPANESTVEMIGKETGIKLVYDYEVFYASGFIPFSIDVTDVIGNKVGSATVTYTAGGWPVEESMTIRPENDITEPGVYNFVIPAGKILRTDTNDENAKMTLSYTVTGGAKSLTYLSPYRITPENGSTLSSLNEIVLKYTGYLDILPEAYDNPELAQVDLLDGDGNLVEKIDVYTSTDMATNITTVTITPSEPITIPDYYTLDLPKGMLMNPQDNSVLNERLLLSYIIDASAASKLNVTNVEPANGAVLQGIATDAIKVYFDKTPDLVDWSYMAKFLPLIDTNTGKAYCNLMANPNPWASPAYLGLVMEADLVTPGTYSLTIPAGFVCEDGNGDVVNDEVTFTWTVEGLSKPGDSTDLDKSFEFISVSYPSQIKLGGTYDYAALGGAIDSVMTSWDGEPSANPTAKPYFEDANGNRTEATAVRSNSGYGQILFNSAATAEWRSGEYTFVIPVNTFGTEEWAASGYTKGVCNPEIVIPFNYIQNPAIVDDDDNEPIVMSKFGWYGEDGTCIVNYLDKPETSPNIPGGATLVIGSNVNEKCMDVYVNIIDLTDGEYIWTAGTFRQQVTSETDIITINGKNAEGDFELQLATIEGYKLEFLSDHEYATEVGFYKQFDGVPEAQRYCYGTEVAHYYGETLGYQYADVEILNVSKPEGTQFDDVNDSSVTITFSKPVTMNSTLTKAYGYQGIVAYASMTSNDEGTEWTLTAPTSLLSNCTGVLDFRFAPRYEGQAIRSDKYYTSGQKDNTYITISYYCFLGGSAIAVSPAGGSEVEELYDFTFTAPTASHKNIGFQGVSPSGVRLNGNVLNAAGEVVATLVTTPDEIEATASGEYNIDCRMHLDKSVTAPGNYTLVIPGAYFMTGTESNSLANKPMTFEYTIAGDVEEQPMEVTFVFFGEDNNMAKMNAAIPNDAAEWPQDTSVAENSKLTVGSDAAADLAYLKLDGVTITSVKNTETAAIPCLYSSGKKYDNVTFRPYKNNTVTISAPEGYCIASMDFVTNTSSASGKVETWSTNVEGKTGEAVASADNNKNFTYKSPEVNVTDVNFVVNGTVQIKSLKVVLAENNLVGVATLEAEDMNATAEYFNMQGIKVQKPGKGMYIRKVGKTATKVIIR